MSILDIILSTLIFVFAAVGAVTLIVLAIAGLHIRRQKKRRSDAAKQAAARSSGITPPKAVDTKDPALLRRFDALCRELEQANVTALLQMIGAAEAACATRQQRGSQFMEQAPQNVERYAGQIVELADRVRGNRKTIDAEGFVALVEAVVRYCAQRLEVFPIEESSHVE